MQWLVLQRVFTVAICGAEAAGFDTSPTAATVVAQFVT